MSIFLLIMYLIKQLSFLIDFLSFLLVLMELDEYKGPNKGPCFIKVGYQISANNPARIYRRQNRSDGQRRDRPEYLPMQ